MNKGISVWPPSLRLAHWASAALVFAALGLGTYMVQFVHDPAERFELTQTHKSIGVAVLALTVVRLCLRILTNAPKPELRRHVQPGNRYSGVLRLTSR
jgi:cytochrome b561